MTCNPFSSFLLLYIMRCHAELFVFFTKIADVAISIPHQQKNKVFILFIYFLKFYLHYVRKISKVDYKKNSVMSCNTPAKLYVTIWFHQAYGFITPLACVYYKFTCFIQLFIDNICQKVLITLRWHTKF